MFLKKLFRIEVTCKSHICNFLLLVIVFESYCSMTCTLHDFLSIFQNLKLLTLFFLIYVKILLLLFDAFE